MDDPSHSMVRIWTRVFRGSLFRREISMMNEATPKFGLEGKAVLVTGAARGIGRACALACAGSGADVVVGVRNLSDGEALANEIEALGRRARAVQMDLSDLGSVRTGVGEANDAFGRIDVLVNNVGVGPENLAENVTEEDFEYTVDINLKGTFFTTQAVGRLMIAQKSGGSSTSARRRER